MNEGVSTDHRLPNQGGSLFWYSEKLAAVVNFLKFKIELYSWQKDSNNVFELSNLVSLYILLSPLFVNVSFLINMAFN